MARVYFYDWANFFLFGWITFWRLLLLLLLLFYDLQYVCRTKLTRESKNHILLRYSNDSKATVPKCSYEKTGTELAVFPFNFFNLILIKAIQTDWKSDYFTTKYSRFLSREKRLRYELREKILMFLYRWSQVIRCN